MKGKELTPLGIVLGVIVLFFILKEITISQVKDVMDSLSIYISVSTPHGLLKYIVSENTVITSIYPLDKVLLFGAGLIPSIIISTISKKLFKIRGLAYSVIFIMIYVFVLTIIASWIFWATIGGIIIALIILWLLSNREDINNTDANVVTNNEVKKEIIVNDKINNDQIIKKELTEDEINYIRHKELIANKICPKCGARLVYRQNSKNGNKFLGCINFPITDCDYTVDYKEYIDYQKAYNKVNV